MLSTLSALFPTPAAAQAAVQQLLAAGFTPDQLEVATSATLRAAHVAPPADTADAPAGPNSALVSVQADPGPAADRARALLTQCGGTDVHQQGGHAAPDPATGPDLAGDISLLRDDNNLDANGLTTH